MEATKKLEVILGWVSSSTNDNQLSLCKDVAREHFVTRDNIPDYYNQVMLAIDTKQVLPATIFNPLAHEQTK